MEKLTLYHYLSMPDEGSEKLKLRKQLLAERKIYFSDPRTFNDPLDCNMDIIKQINEYIPPQDFRFFCLAGEERDDALMFAHYADGHRGFRLKFEVIQDGFYGFTLANAKEVKYINSIDLLPEIVNETNAMAFFHTKLKPWAYEQEYRVCVASYKKSLEGEDDKPFYMKYLEDQLVEVALGYKFDNKKNYRHIKSWLYEGNHNSVKIVKAVPGRDQTGFDYEFVEWIQSWQK